MTSQRFLPSRPRTIATLGLALHCTLLPVWAEAPAAPGRDTAQHDTGHHDTDHHETGHYDAEHPDAEHMVVTASRREEDIASIPGSVQVFHQAELRQQAQPGQNLGDVLAQLLPSLGVSTQTRTSASQTLRGRSVLILIDGVPQNDNRDVSRHYDNIQLAHVERVEVLSGASAIYGAGGTGGIINIITRRNRGEPLAFLTGTGATFSSEQTGSDGLSLTATQSLTGKLGLFDSYIGLSYEQRANAFDADGNQIAPEPAQTSLGDTTSKDLLFKLGYDLSAGQRLDVSFDLYENEQDTNYGPNYGGPGVPVLIQRQNAPVVAIDGLQLAEQPVTEREAISAQYHHDAFFGQVLRALAYQREREFRFFPFPQQLIPGNSRSIVVNQSTSKANVAGAKIALEATPHRQVNFVYGIDYERDQGEQTAHGYDALAFLQSGGLVYQPIGSDYDYGPAVETRKQGYFLQSKWQWTPQFNLRAGVRHERIAVDVDDSVPVLETFALSAGFIPEVTVLPGATLDYDATLYNLGAVYQFNELHELFGNYSQGFELPDTARLLRNAIAPNSLTLQLPGVRGGTIVADSELEAVTVDNLELGYRWHDGSVNASVVLYGNQSEKTAVFNPDYSVDILDQDKRIVGVEATVEWYPDESWSLGLGLGHTQGETRNASTGEWQALSAFEVAPGKLTLFVGYQHAGHWDTRLQLLRLADYDDAHQDNPAEARIDGYTTVDWLTGVELPLGQLGFSVKNLLNESYQTVYSQWAQNIYGSFVGLPAAGRTVALTYVVSY